MKFQLKKLVHLALIKRKWVLLHGHFKVFGTRQKFEDSEHVFWKVCWLTFYILPLLNSYSKII